MSAFDPRSRNRLHGAALLAVLLVAACLRTAAIGREGLWADEALTLVLAHYSVGEMIFDPTDPTPALYYLLHKLFIPDGATAAVARSLSAVAGLLSVLAIYWVARLSFGRSGGLIAAALLAVWTPHVDYSQEARAYSLLVLLTLLSAGGLLWWFDETGREVQRRLGPVPRRCLALAAFVLSTMASFYTHLVAVFWIAPALQIILSLTLRTRPQRFMPELVAALAVMAMLAAPNLLRMFREAALPDAFHWLPQADAHLFVATVADLSLPSGLWLNVGVEARGFAEPLRIASGLIMVGLLLLAVARHRSRSREERPAAAVVAVVAALLSLPLLLWLFGFFVRPIFMPRTALYAVPGFVLLLTGVLRSLPTRRATAYAAIGAVGVHLAGTLLFGLTRPKEPWPVVAKVLAERVRPGDVVIVCAGWKFPALRHVIPRPLGVAAVMSFGSFPLLLERDLGADRAWSSRYLETITRLGTRMRSGQAADYRYLPTDLATAGGATFWMVRSECELEESAALNAWIGTAARWTPVWSAPGGLDYADIAVSKTTPTGPGARTILTPQRR